jgi:hypothetical protein
VADIAIIEAAEPAPGVLTRNVSPPDESKRDQATRHVIEGRGIVAKQRAIIDRLKTLGLETYSAEILLSQFETSQAIFEADLKAIVRDEEISNRNDENSN